MMFSSFVSNGLRLFSRAQAQLQSHEVGGSCEVALCFTPITLGQLGAGLKPIFIPTEVKLQHSTQHWFVMDDWQLQVISGHVVCKSGLLISRKCH